MKKVLSIALALVMILSVIPVAYATEKSVKDIFIEECIRYNVLMNNYQMNGDTPHHMGFHLSDSEFLNPIRANDVEVMLDWIDFFKSESSRIEEKIASEEIIILIDTNDFMEYYVKTMMAACIDIATLDRFNEICDMHPEIVNECDTVVESKIPRSKTQAEFDAYAKIWIDGCDLMLKHTYGEHDFIEYISDNNATEDADGTKTATCEFCGATDTITDEGTKLPKEEASLYEIIFDLIKGLFAFILSVFN